MSDEEIVKLAMIAGLIERLDLTRFDWLPALRKFASLLQSAGRERCCAKYLRDAAAYLAPDGNRVTKVDLYTVSVPASNGDKLASVRLA